MQTTIKITFVAVILTIISTANLRALPSFEGKVFGLLPLNNEVSFYRNVDDSGADRGATFQIIAINSIKIFTHFNFELTGDFNWDMSYLTRDHYIELSLVKPVTHRFSVNYQRVISSFEDKPINQFGLRFTF